jgi:hypothetical protein
MDTNSSKRSQQQIKRLRQRFMQDAPHTLAQVLPEEQLQASAKRYAEGCRQRCYPPMVTLGLFLEQVMSADQSCQDAVARALSARLGQGLPASSLNTGPYCRARQRLPLRWLHDLGALVGQRLSQAQPAAWRWRGREVKLIDGTTVSMPDTAANQAAFTQNAQQKAGLGFPMARMVGIISLGCGAVLEWQVGPCEGKNSGEPSMLREMRQSLARGDIVLADRYYAGYFMLAHLLRLGVDVVVRQHQRRHTDFEQGERLAARDHIVHWVKPQRPAWMDEASYEAAPEVLRLRQTQVGGWILVSSLCDGSVSKQDLGRLYGWRWQVELDFRSIKSVMQMDVLRCRTEVMVRKEIAAHLLAYNLVRAVMAQAACMACVVPRALSFKAALQQLRAFERNLRHQPEMDSSASRQAVIHAIGTRRLPHRPGRIEPRVVKRRPKPHPLMTKPRAELRAQLLNLQLQHIAGLEA